METNDLIRRLTAAATPVDRLPPPSKRAGYWMAAALPAVALVVMLVSPRDDLAMKLMESRFAIEQAAAFLTAIAAAFAAFYLIVPGRSVWVAALPIPPLALWLASLGDGCLRAWLQPGADGLRFYPDWICLPAIALVGFVPAVVMVLMLRRGAPLAPHLTMALGALAAAALGNFGLRLFHQQDASLMVLIWQFGSVALISALASWNGARLLNWGLARRAGLPRP